MTQALPTRKEIDQRFKWNAESVFPTAADWEVEAANVQAAIGEVTHYQSRLAEGPQVVAEALAAVQELTRRVYVLSTYADMAYVVDTTDADASKRYSRAHGLSGQAAAAAAFVDPEFLAIGEETLRRWLTQEPQLAHLEHYIDNLFRRQAHVRSAEVEELLGMVSDPFANVEHTYSLMVDADFKHPAAIGADGRALPVSGGNLPWILASPDREARRTAWEGYMDSFLAFKNAQASNLTTSVKANVFAMRARRHESTLELALFPWNITPEVFHSLIDVFKKNLPTWHRYWRVRRKALRVAELCPYDVWAPLSESQPKVPYERGVELICEGLAPLGQEYVDTVRRGCTEERWIDVYPNHGKQGGALSTGAPGTHPFINMTYTDEVFSMSTLAHELGHSMHSYLTWQNQPVLYSNYGMFVAETASNFHQALVRTHLLETIADPAFQLAVIEEAMSNFHRYFFTMPTLARFELEVHRREERGEGMSADDMIELMADLFSEGYGGEMHVDRPRVGITWATFGHLYVDYYVFQYATGIAAANALVRRIRSGAPRAVEDYLRFLKSGNALYPVDALKLAGVDMTTPEPVEEAFTVLEEMVDRLEELVG
jgi:oligoendopeptidase F